VTFHSARSTAYPQPAAGVGPGPGPLKVPADQLPGMLGITSVSVVKHPARWPSATRRLHVHDARRTSIGSARRARAGGCCLALLAASILGGIDAGATVTWANMDDEPHTVVSDTGLFARERSIPRRASPSSSTTGHLSFHVFDPPGMVGTIVVQ